MKDENRIDNRQSDPDGEKAPTFDAQIRRILETVEGWGESVHVHRAPFSDVDARRAFMNKIGLGPRRGGRASIVPADECAIELGAPKTANVNMVLWTNDPSLVRHGEIRLMGPDMKPGEKVSWPFAQVVTIALDSLEETDPFMFESTQYLSNRLSGFMVRTVPGRMWVRVSREAIDGGMDFARLGGALIAAYQEDFPNVTGAEVLFVTLDDDHVRALEPAAAEARIITGKNKKLVLVQDGEYECIDLDCDDCDEQETCDEVMDIVILRRKGKEAEG